jgi:hypothetical protein
MAAPSLWPAPADPAPPHLALTNDVRADVPLWVQTVETVVELIDPARAGRRLVRFAYEIAKSEFALPVMPGA